MSLLRCRSAWNTGLCEFREARRQFMVANDQGSAVEHAIDKLGQ